MRYLVVCFLVVLVACGDDLQFKSALPGPDVVTVKGEKGDPGPATPGPSGPAGEDGVSPEPGPWSIVDVIDPCGDDPGHADEVLIKFMNGKFLAYFKESGNDEFLALLECGKSYHTTDHQNCSFKITNDCKFVEDN